MKLVGGRIRTRLDSGKLSWSVGVDHLPKSLHVTLFVIYAGVEW